MLQFLNKFQKKTLKKGKKIKSNYLISWYIALLHTHIYKEPSLV